MRWHVKVALRTLYLLMIRKIGLRLVNCDDMVLLALVSREEGLSITRCSTGPRIHEERENRDLTSLHWPRNPI